MSRLRKNNSASSILGNNHLYSDENDIQYYLSHRTINKTLEIKLKKSHLKGYLDLSNVGLYSIPEEIFKLNYSVDGNKWWINVDFTKIDLSYNYLNEKNCYGFRRIPHAKILYLDSNKFNIIPNYIYYLKKLVLLDMSNNLITYIDDNFCWNFSNLKVLNLSGNRLKFIPSSIRYMINLQCLSFAKNELTSIPNELIYVKYLKKLNISWNKIQLIEPNIFSELFSLEELYCNNNLLTNLENINNYRVFDSIINLKILDLSHNLFQDFLVFRQLQSLEKINVSYNKLRNIYGLNFCEKLVEIDCSNNSIKEFPDEFLSIKSLYKLNISNNELNDLPSYICLLDNLAELNIEGNPMEEAPSLKYSSTFQIKRFLRNNLSKKDIYFMPENLKNNYIRKINSRNNYNTITNKYPYVQSSIFNFIKNNTELVIANAELKEIPFDMIKYYIPEGFLTAINLSGNQIEKGLEYFRNILYLLKNIKSLNFSKNNIKYFPMLLLTLPNLEELYLSRNLLSIFPAKNLIDNNYTNITPYLQILDLSNNKLEQFPIIIEFFKKLKLLNLSGNNINNINCLIHMRLENLEKFFIDDNKIYEIPQDTLFRSIPNVQTFTISNNYLTDIPTDLFLLIFLENVNFYGNYITNIPLDCLLTADDLKNYLKKYHVYSDEQRYFELKQEEKLRKNYYIFKDKQKMNKTNPTYRSKRNDYNFNYNNFGNKKLWNSINYNNENQIYKSINKGLSTEFRINKFMNGLNETKKLNRSLEDINSDIYEIESFMKQPRLQPHVKANLKKKFRHLILERADYYK